MKAGQIDILNTGGGHVEIHFDPNNPMECERAKRAITDMLKRGSILFIHGAEQQLIRVEQFDPTKNIYIISDVPGVEKVPELAEAPVVEIKGEKKREVPAAKAKVTAIGRSAGG